MIAAEVLAWVPVAYVCDGCADVFWRAFRHDEFGTSFCEVLTVFAVLAWFVSVPVFIRRGRRVWTTFVLVFEMIVWNACFFVPRCTCMDVGNAVLLSTCLLLWLPPSIRWSASRNVKDEYYIRFTVREIGKDSSVHASTISEVAIYGKNEGARTDSHPENPEDGPRAPFTDDKIAFYLSYVNGGKAKGDERR